jgi:hypothetical protein
MSRGWFFMATHTDHSPRHGTHAMFVGGCRCGDCRQANTNYMRRYRDRINPSPLKRYAARVVDALPHLHPEDADAIRAILRGATT